MSCISQVAAHTDDPQLRFAATFVHQQPAFKLGSFCRQLAVPNRFKDAAQLVLQQQKVLRQSTALSHEQLFELLESIDYWRRPERLAQLLELRRALGHPVADHSRIEAAAAAARQLNAQQLVAEGLQGREIGEALTRKRRELFINVLTRHTD